MRETGPVPELTHHFPSKPIDQNLMQMVTPRCLVMENIIFVLDVYPAKFSSLNTVEEWKRDNGKQLAFFAKVNNFI